MKRLYLSRRAVVQLTSVALCLAAALVLLGVRTALRYTLDSQTAAQRWSAGAEGRYAQVTACLTEEAAMDAHSLQEVQGKIDAALAAESLAAADNARLWVWAYSAQATLNLANGSTNASCRAIATGGDYFNFHPLDMVSGWYYDEDDLMQDQVILDRTLAWTLFGGYHLTGMTVTVGGVPCRVVGVAEVPTGTEGSAYGNAPTVWLSWSLYEKLGENVAANCLEAVLPNPVTGFAEKTVTTALGLDENAWETVENSGRFGWLQSLKTLFSLGKRTQRTTALQYPYWENAARLAETRCAFVTAGILLLLLWPLVRMVWLVIAYTIRGKHYLERKIRGRKL